LSVCRVLPDIPKPRHEHRPTIAESDREGLPLLAVRPKLLPFVEAMRHGRGDIYRTGLAQLQIGLRNVSLLDARSKPAG